MKDKEKIREYARTLYPDASRDVVESCKFHAFVLGANWANEKIDKLKRLADEMYFRVQTLSTDPRPLRKAMEDYHNFIINEYNE